MTLDFTGYTLDGGYAEYTVASADYCFPLETPLPDVEAAPLLCAGLIGYRCLRFAGDARQLGIYGFGAAAHIIAQVAVHQGRQVFAFTRPGDKLAQEFARNLGLCGLAARKKPRRKGSMPQSSSRQLARLCRSL